MSDEFPASKTMFCEDNIPSVSVGDGEAYRVVNTDSNSSHTYLSIRLTDTRDRETSLIAGMQELINTFSHDLQVTQDEIRRAVNYMQSRHGAVINADGSERHE